MTYNVFGGTLNLAQSINQSYCIVTCLQIVTVLACMASVESCSQWLSTEAGVAELLVQYLHEKPRSGATTIEKSACERLQQKSAVAIRRLSNSRDVGLIFVELHCMCISYYYHPHHHRHHHHHQHVL